MRAKQFFYVAAGILLLVIAYSVGAHQAGAQSGGQFVGFHVDGNNTTTAMTSNGDFYGVNGRPTCDGTNMIWSHPSSNACANWTYMGNVLGGPIQVQGKSLSDVKSTYRGK